MLSDLRGVAHLIRHHWRAFARHTSARSGAATELLGQSLHPELQRNLLALQLENSPLQLLDRILQLLQLVAMPIRPSPCGIESPGDALVEREQLRVVPVVLEANVVKALLPPEHQRLRPAKMVLVHSQAELLSLGASNGVPTRKIASTSQGNGQCTSNEPSRNTANTF